MKNIDNTEIWITRDFAVPRALVFEAWSSAEHWKQWYAPSGCSLSHCDMDFKVGGELFACIKTPTGYECWCKGVFLEINKPSKLVYSVINTNAEGHRIDPVSIGMDPEWPGKTIVTVVFTEVDGKTRVTLHQNAPLEVAKRTGAYPSWLSMLDRLERKLLKTVT